MASLRGTRFSSSAGSPEDPNPLAEYDPMKADNPDSTYLPLGGFGCP
jgi:hypothetical protein